MVYNDGGLKTKKVRLLILTDMRPLYPPDEEQATMLYTPKYCNQCGEKIERENWSARIVRRFCETCEVEFKGHDWLVTSGAAVLLLLGLFGAGNLLFKSEKPPEIKPAQLAQSSPVERGGSLRGQKNAAPDPVNEMPTQAAGQTTANQTIQKPPSLVSKPPSPNNQPPAAVRASENKSPDDGAPDYFCGAMTKKGMPCSRRVKGGGRCWQHQGQPAILPPEKLLIAAK